MAKTWQQKFDNRKEVTVELLNKDFADLKAGTKMLISTPAEISAYVSAIPKGQTTTVLQMRQDLARKHKADGTCPLTTGIFLRIVSELAWEQIQSGKAPSDVTPFWRIVDPKSPLAKKLACGPGEVMKLREQF